MKNTLRNLFLLQKRLFLSVKKNKITPVIHGGFAHFYYTKDKLMKVNDIDILINKKYIPKMAEILKKEKIDFRYYPKINEIIIKHGRLQIDLDEVGKEHKNLTDKNLLRVSKKINFYGDKVKMMSLKHLKENYPVAYNNSSKDKSKILKKIKHIEKSLGEKI